MKSITIIGNLGANAIRRTAADGRDLMSFNVAVNQPGKEPLWFNCIGNMRENLLSYLVKGQCVAVIGDFNPAIYKNNLDLSISIDRVELCGAKPDSKPQEPVVQPDQEPKESEDAPF